MKTGSVHPDVTHRRRSILSLVIIAVLFASGALHWVLFLHHGQMSFQAHDWPKEFAYTSVIRQALDMGQIPFHVSMRFQGTDRFMAIPETNLSPQILLLPLTSIAGFVVMNTLIMYTIGFLGCLMIKRRYQLSMIPFAFLFLMFNFNGHIIAHLGVGHSMWTGYFLLPFFFLFLLDMAEGHTTRTTPIKLAFVLFAIALQGAFHIYIWCITFLVIFVIFNWRHFKPVVETIVFSVALSSFRLVPALFTLLGRKEKFIWSYPTFRDLLDALITIRERTPERLSTWGSTGWWEYDVYVGIAALAILVYFGIVLRFSKKPYLEDSKFRPLDMPIFVMSLLSISYFHAFISRIPVPFLRSERVATRFIIVPLLALLFVSVIRMEKVLRNVKRSLKLTVVAVGSILLMGLAYIDHSYLWSVGSLERAALKNGAVNLAVPRVIFRHDPSYKAVFWASLGLSLASVAALAYALYRLRRRPATKVSPVR